MSGQADINSCDAIANKHCPYSQMTVDDLKYSH